MGRVKLKATQLDVFVDGVRVGSVFDNGDCWRPSLAKRGRRRELLDDCDTRAKAVRSVVTHAR